MNILLLGRPLHEAYKEMTKFSGDMERQRDAYKKALEMAEDELITARADAEHWKSECNALQRMAHEARAEIERRKPDRPRRRAALSPKQPEPMATDGIP